MGEKLNYRGQAFLSEQTVYKKSNYVQTSITLLIPTIPFDSITKGEKEAEVILSWSCLPTGDERNFEIFVYNSQDNYDNDVVWDTIFKVAANQEIYSEAHNASNNPGKFLCGQKYFYRLRTSTVINDTIWSELTPKSPEPSAYYGWARTPRPIIDSVISDALGEIRVYWSYRSGANYAQIRKNRDSTKIKNVGNYDQYIDNQVFGGHRYGYEVRAINQDIQDTSQWSDIKYGTALLEPPGNVVVSKGSKKESIQLTWSVSSTLGNYGAESYNIWRGTDLDSFTAVGVVEDSFRNISPSANNFVFDDYAIERGQMYYYSVVSAGGTGHISAPSTIDSGWAVVAAPEITAYTGDGGSLPLNDSVITVKWEDPCSAYPASTEYFVTRKMNGDTPTAVKLVQIGSSPNIVALGSVVPQGARHRPSQLNRLLFAPFAHHYIARWLQQSCSIFYVRPL